MVDFRSLGHRPEPVFFIVDIEAIQLPLPWLLIAADLSSRPLLDFVAHDDNLPIPLRTEYEYLSYPFCRDLNFK